MQRGGHMDPKFASFNYMFELIGIVHVIVSFIHLQSGVCIGETPEKPYLILITCIIEESGEDFDIIKEFMQN
ncbi:hypothetical protein SLA2020_203870 [Shorea laevis]